MTISTASPLARLWAIGVLLIACVLVVISFWPQVAPDMVVAAPAALPDPRPIVVVQTVIVPATAQPEPTAAPTEAPPPVVEMSPPPQIIYVEERALAPVAVPAELPATPASPSPEPKQARFGGRHNDNPGPPDRTGPEAP